MTLVNVHPGSVSSELYGCFLSTGPRVSLPETFPFLYVAGPWVSLLASRDVPFFLTFEKKKWLNNQSRHQCYQV